MLAALLLRLCGVLRSHVMVNKEHRSFGFAILEMAYSHQGEGITEALDGWFVGSRAIRVSRLDHSPIESLNK